MYMHFVNFRFLFVITVENYCSPFTSTNKEVCGSDTFALHCKALETLCVDINYSDLICDISAQSKNLILNFLKHDAKLKINILNIQISSVLFVFCKTGKKKLLLIHTRLFTFLTRNQSLNTCNLCITLHNCSPLYFGLS